MSNKLPGFHDTFQPETLCPRDNYQKKKFRLKGMTGSNLINEKHGFELFRYDNIYFVISVLVRTMLKY